MITIRRKIKDWVGQLFFILIQSLGWAILCAVIYDVYFSTDPLYVRLNEVPDVVRHLQKTEP
jgi:hypothetical protein